MGIQLTSVKLKIHTIINYGKHNRHLEVLYYVEIVVFAAHILTALGNT